MTNAAGRGQSPAGLWRRRAQPSGAGTGGMSIGALGYPNVYSVDPRHPAASDEGFGYPGRPYKTVKAALDAAVTGETVILRGGVYRETLTAFTRASVAAWREQEAAERQRRADLMACYLEAIWEREEQDNG
jgi:hypothetical protein